MEFIEQDNRPERESSRTLGDRGERLAAEYLQRMGVSAGSGQFHGTHRPKPKRGPDHAVK
jgi:hypothetical protein